MRTETFALKGAKFLGSHDAILFFISDDPPLQGVLPLSLGLFKLNNLLSQQEKKRDFLTDLVDELA